ncbi:MAG: tRNA1(Val) (adenine(37)-N6)-methyltransferase [Cetobacterium sp.]|uniref:tRNA1(Val) (adenine(37)-N6)-methyltransferase n=1 Tax=unclassified Cetobacterium TaxID=2630983 RepID=UPI00163C08EC|nr:tRNA1(Val) (adenine(37)-N6)-methyltransferase [Cetobacterium sp. 2A]MBC2855660.1 tRNA1(Val) (adenine(37)-N6)-methyltransferase [Cetobacterium sp. 2A]
MLSNENETIIDLLKKGLKIIQRSDYFNFSLDSLLVSEFITINRNTKKIVDLGTGNASIPLFLSKKTTAKIIGLEIQEVSADLAKRNVALNNLQDKIEIIHDDMKNWKNYIVPNSQDAVITNPPFFKYHGNDNLLNDLDQLTLARHEISINLDELISTASALLKDKGYFTMVHRPDRLIDIIETMKKYNIEPKRIRFCHSKEGKNAKIILIEGLKYGNSGLTILPPLYAHDETGGYSSEVLQMFQA